MVDEKEVCFRKGNRLFLRDPCSPKDCLFAAGGRCALCFFNIHRHETPTRDTFLM